VYALDAKPHRFITQASLKEAGCMFHNNFRVAYVLSSLMVILGIIASVGGLFLAELYRDNELVKNTWFINDLLTLVVMTPLLIGSLTLSIRGSQRAQLVWVAMLSYMLYNFAFYLFGTAFNVFFLVYVAIVSLALFALIFSLSSLDVTAISQAFRASTPVRWISSFMVFIGVFLGFKWIADSLNFVFTGQLPKAILDFAQPTNIVFALDLTLIVPWMIVGAIWLWQHQPWGYVVSAIMTMKAATYGLVLVTSTLYSALSGNWDTLFAFYAFVFLGGVISVWFLLGNMYSKNDSETPTTSAHYTRKAHS
jgi:hypothetical protein